MNLYNRVAHLFVVEMDFLNMFCTITTRNSYSNKPIWYYEFHTDLPPAVYKLHAFVQDGVCVASASPALQMLDHDIILHIDLVYKHCVCACVMCVCLCVLCVYVCVCLCMFVCRVCVCVYLCVCVCVVSKCCAQEW